MDREKHLSSKLEASMKSVCHPNIIPPLVPVAGRYLQSLKLYPKTSFAVCRVIIASFVSFKQTSLGVADRIKSLMAS
jgi:hypothetical protein